MEPENDYQNHRDLLFPAGAIVRLYVKTSGFGDIFPTTNQHLAGEKNPSHPVFQVLFVSLPEGIMVGEKVKNS